MRAVSCGLVGIALAALAGCTIAHVSAPEAPAGVVVVGVDTAKPLPWKRAVLVVHGMGCPLCSANVHKRLTSLPGVEQVAPDLNMGRVAVTMTEGKQPTAQQFADALRDSGFTLVRIEQAQ
jgi:copper chaperone CopZ